MRPSENLGQVLFGERIESSPYKVGVTRHLRILIAILPYLFSVVNAMLIVMCLSTVQLQRRH